MVKAVEVVGQAEQERLAALRISRSAGSATGEFAFDSGKHCLDPGTPTVFLAWEVGSPLGTYAANTAGFLAALGRHDTVGPDLRPDEDVVAFGVELGIR